MMFAALSSSDVARPSRPPGFDMAYRPAESVYGPPILARLPSLIYLVIAAAAVSFVIAGEMAPTNTWLHIYVVEKDVHRVLGARMFATLLSVSALAAFARSSMRGVRVRRDGIECREILTLIWPRVRRIRWAQIDRIILDQKATIVLDLWDGSREDLPIVGDRKALSAVLEKVGHARAIPVRGGVGLDELPESEDEIFDD